jgi:hypothetical protein
MRNEIPSLESAGNARRETPPPVDTENKGENKRNKVETAVKAKYTPEQVKRFADTAAEKLRAMANIPEYVGMSYPLKRDRAIRACLKIPRFRELSAEEEALMKLIKSELSGRGAGATNKKKQSKKMHTVPERRVFTPAQIKSMSKQAEERQAQDEERAGEPWKRSGIES